MGKIEEVDIYECPECGQIYEDEYDAEDCCPKDDVYSDVGYKCVECGELFINEDDAKECCED